MTKYLYAANMITTDLETGNSLADIIDGTSGSDSFTNNPLANIGSAEVTAWGGSVRLTQGTYDAFNEFIAGGYPLALTASGMTTAQIDAARAVMTIETGEANATEAGYGEFLASNNYETISTEVEI